MHCTPVSRPLLPEDLSQAEQEEKCYKLIIVLEQTLLIKTQRSDFDYAQFTSSSTFSGLSQHRLSSYPPLSAIQQAERAGTLEVAAKRFLVDSANVSQAV